MFQHLRNAVGSERSWSWRRLGRRQENERENIEFEYEQSHVLQYMALLLLIKGDGCVLNGKVYAATRMHTVFTSQCEHPRCMKYVCAFVDVGMSAIVCHNEWRPSWHR